MRAIVIGGGMSGLFTAVALRRAGEVFEAVDVYEQTRKPTTAGAGLNVAPNGARLCSWLGIDLDGGDPKGPDGVLDGGRAAIIEHSREIGPNFEISDWPFPRNGPEDHARGAGFHHMHRQDLLMCLHKKVAELGPESGVRCPITLHMGKRLTRIDQDQTSATVTFEDGTTATGDVVLGADGINSETLKLVFPDTPERRFTGALIYRGLIHRDRVATLTTPDGGPLGIDCMGSIHDTFRADDRLAMYYWVRGGELLNVALTWYEPDSTEFTEDWGDWHETDHDELVATMDKVWAGDPRRDTVVAMGAAMENPTKWGLYDRDALESWVDGRVALLGDAAHPMLPTFGQGASQSFEDGAALSKCFELHGDDVDSALAHYERVRHYRATRFQYGSKMAFKLLEPEDSVQRQEILRKTNERDVPVFDHEQRVGDDDSWIYDYDAREIGAKLPLRRLGPADFRDREVTKKVWQDLTPDKLWKPAHPPSGDHGVTAAELAEHASFEDAWVVIAGQVYDISEWKNRHPGGPFIARLYAGKDATAGFGQFHSRAAQRHMKNFLVGPFVGDRVPTA
jgi:salicylate hydroxylase